MRILVGLGNPGAKYETTRHNAGFLILDLIADDCRANWSTSKFDALVAKGLFQGQETMFVKPQTYMNLSGKSVARMCRFYKVSLEDVIVIHDDIDMEFGKVKARASGGHGGHNGIRSMISELGANNFHRLKIGVGRPKSEENIDVANWVLDSFTDNELLELQAGVLEAVTTRLKGLYTP